MTKCSRIASGLPTNGLKATSSDLPQRDTARQDEWLLDEALAETFPKR